MSRTSHSSAASSPSLYPWGQVGAGWLAYGLGLAPAYYSWGFFAPEIIADLGLDRTQAGLVFGVFTFVFSAVGPLVGLTLDRIGLRRTISCGALTAAVGFFILMRAETFWHCLIGYGIVGGIGIGFSTILPAQTLAARWFVRQRARALAILMTAGSVVGLAVPLVNTQILEMAHWRLGWAGIAATSVLVAGLAALLLRDSPEAVGLLPDGDRPDGAHGRAATRAEPQTDAARPSVDDNDELQWTALAAIKTPHFALLTLCGVAYSGPWGVVIAHGRLHFEDMGLATESVAVVLSTMILVSTLGRLSGALGDLLAPNRVLGLAIALVAAGMFLLLAADDRSIAQLATLLVGIGFGAAYVSTAATFAGFFGREAFATTAGTRLMLGAMIGPALPPLAGWVADVRGSYDWMWIGLGVFAAIIATLIINIKPPRLEPTASISGEETLA